VVLADCSREAADLKRRELQARIAEIELDVRAGRRLSLAVSAGASVYPEDGSTYEALLTDADQRMYRDKAARRGLMTVPHATGSPEFLAADIFDTAPAIEPDVPQPHTLG
jgi:diguanylate cyclase (GGDEF)-like protein